MLLVIPGVLGPRQLQQARALLEKGHFVDGRLSAGKSARRIKNNEELHTGASQMQRLNALVMGALVDNPLYQAAAMPHRVATPFYARYSAGMTYGDHVDDPVMGPPGGQYRTDVSTTIFLNEPEDYEGGELVVRTPFGDQRVKQPAGDAVVYPSSSLHHVAEVSSGERLVAVTWTQSMIRSPQQRELLFELYQTRESLLEKQPEAEETTRIDHVYVNLVRMWAEL